MRKKALKPARRCAHCGRMVQFRPWGGVWHWVTVDDGEHHSTGGQPMFARNDDAIIMSQLDEDAQRHMGDL